MYSRGSRSRDGAQIKRRKREESHLSALLHRRCTPVYIGRGRKKGAALLPYWHIAANQPSCFFPPFARQIDSIQLSRPSTASILYPLFCFISTAISPLRGGQIVSVISNVFRLCEIRQNVSWEQILYRVSSKDTCHRTLYGFS